MRKSEYHNEVNKIVNEILDLSDKSEMQLETSKFLAKQADMLLEEMDDSLLLSDKDEIRKRIITLVGRLEAEARITENDSQKLNKCETELKHLKEKRRLEGLE